MPKFTRTGGKQPGFRNNDEVLNVNKFRLVWPAVMAAVLLNVNAASASDQHRNEASNPDVDWICAAEPGCSSGPFDWSAEAASRSQDDGAGTPQQNPPSAAVPVSENRHELRVGSNVDVFNFADPANAETISLQSKWTPRYSTFFSETFFQRFGETGGQTNAALTVKFTPHLWLTAGGGAANRQDVVARELANVELGMAHSINNRFFKGSELYLQQRNYWFTATRVSSFGATDLLYLPRDWTITVSGAAARTLIEGIGPAWTSSGFARLNFPLSSALTGNVLYGFGAENFGSADQIGRISARSVGGGLQYRFRGNQDVMWSVVRQDRSQGQLQYSCGMTYGLHF